MLLSIETAIQVENIIRASYRLNSIAAETPVQFNRTLSEKYEANIYLKREDLQIVRSYKIRGAYNLMSQLPKEQAKKGIVCASAGNHAQGVAYSCQLLGINGKIYMPTTTPQQKIKRVQLLGKKYVEVVLCGDTYDAAFAEARSYSEKSGKVLVPPFDHPLIVEGQGTVGVEILKQFKGHVDFLFIPVGGGGLSAGVGSYVKRLSPDTQIIGAEPAGAPAMKRALEEGQVVMLDNIDTFVDGAAVRKVGELPLEICKQILDDVVLVPEGKICTFILSLYNDDAIVVEPAGALSIAALDFYRSEIKGKNVVCIVSGGNNDIERMPEIKDRSLIYEGLKHYFIIKFPQRAGALRDFLDKVLGPDDEITDFEYTKKHNRNSGPAMVGIELKHKEDYAPLIERMESNNYEYIVVNDNYNLFSFLV
ncbi:threonine dehydratase [Sphingobacteriales bacterium UPWRP_1]|nr:threonine dehydratase [Sphingobacteriales bacterium TSM_CSM]PSJ78142.1 threonine dehydratase [Sphingobacteriales bacterium UPWRP_1]